MLCYWAFTVASYACLCVSVYTCVHVHVPRHAGSRIANAKGKSCELQAQHALCVVRSRMGLANRVAEQVAEHVADHNMHVLTGATDAGRGGGKGRGNYAGEKRPRNLERLTAAAAQSAVDMSLEHEYSD